MKYRKKPIVIEAFQMTKERRQDNSEWPDWLNQAWNKDWKEVGAVFPRAIGTSDGELDMHTLEGPLHISFDDWIIQGVKGELYPCKDEIFRLTYELVQP